MKTRVSFKKLDEHTKRFLEKDKSLSNFWSKYFSNKYETGLFIKNSLRKLLTRRMMLRVKWYVDIADGMPKVRDSRPALQVVFLVALAESVARRKFTKKQADSLGSQKLILDFFKHLQNSDKEEFGKKFKRALVSIKHHRLSISSVVRILYQVRNDAVHGKEYWGFDLVDKKRHSDSDKPYWSLITTGWLGTRKRKRRVNLDIKLTYEDLRDIFIRTAIKNIESKF